MFDYRLPEAYITSTGLIRVIYFLTHISLASFLWDIGKQYNPRCDAAERGVASEAILFAWRKYIEKWSKNSKSLLMTLKMKGLVQMITMGKSIRHIWFNVKQVVPVVNYGVKLDFIILCKLIILYSCQTIRLLLCCMPLVCQNCDINFFLKFLSHNSVTEINKNKMARI